MAGADVIEIGAPSGAHLGVSVVSIQASPEQGDDVGQGGVARRESRNGTPSRHPVTSERDVPGFVGCHRLEEGADGRTVLPEIPASSQFGEQEAFQDPVQADDPRGSGTQRVGATEERPKTLGGT